MRETLETLRQSAAGTISACASLEELDALWDEAKRAEKA